MKKNIENDEDEIQMLSVQWDNIGLHKLHRFWMQQENTKYIVHVDIHNNQLKELPGGFFEMLPMLEGLDISCNEMVALPADGLIDSRYGPVMFLINLEKYHLKARPTFNASL